MTIVAPLFASTSTSVPSSSSTRTTTSMFGWPLCEESSSSPTSSSSTTSSCSFPALMQEPFLLPTTTNTSSSSLCGMKRSWKEEDEDEMQQDNIGSCFKKIRISASSPGELRLDRDLQALTTTTTSKNMPNVHWQTWNGRLWHTSCNNHRNDDGAILLNVVLERTNALELILNLQSQQQQQEAQFRIQLSRMYPHTPPSIQRIRQSSLQEPNFLWSNISVSLAQPHIHQQQKDFSHHDYLGNDLCYDWTPIHQIGELLQFILHHALNHVQHQQQRQSAMTRHYNNAVPGTTDQQMHNHHSFEHFLSPNRFNVGYDHSSTTTISNNDMECL